MIRRRTTRRPKGIAMVEYLVAAPMLIMLMYAASEIGRAFMQYNTLTKSIRDGVRFVADKALFGSTGTVQVSATVQNQARNLVAYGNIAGTGPAILPGLTAGNITVTGSNTGNVSISATYAYQPVFLQLPFFQWGSPINPNFTFNADVTMRAL